MAEHDISQASRPLNLDTDWTYKVAVLSHLAAKRMSDVVREVSDLNLSQWRVLAAVADKSGRTSKDVVSVTPMDKGLVSRAVSALVESGMLERRASANDGRLSHLHMTDEGARAYTAIVDALNTRNETLGDALSTAQDKEFIATLDKLISAYQDD